MSETPDLSMPPVPPESTPDHPLSEIAPGDELRELIHELRNARAAIQMAEHTFVRRGEMITYSTKKDLVTARRSSTQRFYALIGVIILAVVSLVIVGIIATSAYNGQQRALAREQFSSCQERNARDAGSADFLRGYFAILAQSQDQATAKRVIALLQQFEKKAPTPLPDCNRFVH